MKIKADFRKIVSVIATAALLFNSIAPFSIAIAQELPSPTPTTEATIAPTDNPTATPDAAPAETASPTPEVTSTPTDFVTPTPSATPVVTQAPESNPTTTAPPTDSNNQNSSPSTQSTTTPTLSATPTTTPEPQENPSLDSTILTTNVFPQTLEDNSWFKLITDKLDYSPTDIVQISGSGFIPNKDYTLEVVSTDAPAVDFTTQVKADGSGNINYSYQLDGNYRPNYTIYIKDGEVIVTTTTFTDSVSGISATVNGSTSITVLQGATINVSVTATLSGSQWKGTEWLISSSAPGSMQCENTTDHTSDGTFTESFNVTAPSTDGTYNLYIKTSNNNGCNGTLSDLYTLSNAIIVNGSSSSGNSSASLDQYANDVPTGWVNGDLNASKATYREGDSVPYRMLLSGIGSGPHTLVIQWDTTKGGLHAIDYLTSFDRTVSSANPCLGVAGCGSPSTYPIPVDTNITGFTPVSGNLTIYNGTITGVSAYTLTAPYTGDSSTSIEITFTATNSTPVIAWGGHIGSQEDWGTGNSASSISGSPYHMRLKSLDGSGGNQDRALAAAAVLPTPIINTQVSSGSLFVNGSVTDTATLSGSANNSPAVTGSVNFYLCGPNSSNPDCTTGGTLVGSTKTISGGSAISDVYTATQLGNYCFRAEYVPDLLAQYSPFTHTNLTTECFNVSNPPTATLTLVKTLTKDNGGTALATDWTLSASGSATISGKTGDASITNATVNPDTYTLSETGPTGYTASDWSCVKNGGTAVLGSSITLTGGDNATCTINNDDNIPSLTLTKIVSNTHGGNAVPANWTLSADGPTPISGAGGATSDSTFKAGTYTLSESTGPAGYSAGSWSCVGATIANGDQITLAVGQSASCSITNSDQQSYVTVTKVVNNDHGGSANPDDFKLTLDGSAVLSGTKTPVNPGSHTVAETLLPGYSFDGFSGDCTTASLSVALGESKTCTLTNSDKQAYITVVKNVIKDNGGTANPDDFKLTLEGNPVLSGVAVAVDPGTYTAAETQLPGYSFIGFSDECDGNGDLTVALGESKTCTLTNDDIAPSLTMVKNVVNNYGGNEPATAWTLYASSGPTPISGAGGVVSDGTFKAGTYTLSESAGPSGYIPGNWSCTGDATNTGNSITLSLGQNATCSITNSDVPASITVDKITNPSGASDLFTFNLSGTITGSAQLSDASTPYTFSGLSVGTYSLTEEDVAGWDLTNVSCTLNRQTSTNLGVSLGLGDSLYCTFTNTQKGHLIVEKTTDPANDPTVFDITASGTGTITGGGAGTVSDTKDQDYEVTPGTYSVIESLSGGSDWNNTNNNCNDVVVAAGKTEYCQLTNQKKGTIVIKKVMIGGTDTFTFTGNISGPISENNGTIISGGKTPKNGFTTTESAKAGWVLTDISCDDGESENPSSRDVRSRTATFNVDAGETVTCTFTNTKYGYMQGRKYTDANMDGRLENGESFLDDWTVRLYNSTWQLQGTYTTGAGGLLTGQYKFGNLLPGIYNACEIQQTGYQQTGPVLGAHAVDYNGNQVNGSTAVANGSGQSDEAPVCWQSTINGNEMEWLGFGNIQLGKIIVEKETNTETEDRFTFSSNYSKNFTLGSGGSNDSGYLLPGDYSVSELTQNNWQLGSATCDNEDSPSNIHLGAGDIVTCRFVNNELVPGVSITKSNDSGSGITAGATVTYTLNVKNTGSIDFNNVYVYDYLPGGFAYVSGSVNGADFISLVGSKLTLNLSSLAAGATATVTYKVSTNSALANGTYTNYATCQARYYEESILPCDPANSNVTIGNGIGYGGNLQGQVLGASTELPATGSPTELLLISLAILGIGIFLNGYTMRKQKKAKGGKKGKTLLRQGYGRARHAKK